MKNTILSIITAKDEFELVKKTNEDKRDFFATQPYQKNNGTWIMFCYSHKQGELNKSDSPNLQESKSPPATKEQIDLLYKLDANFDAKTITKKEAFLLIQKLLSKKK